MIHGKLKCPNCSQELELSATKAPAQQSSQQPRKSNGGSLGELLDSISDDGLTGKAAEFVTQMREKYEQYGERTHCSEKQRAWLERIATGEDSEW